MQYKFGFVAFAGIAAASLPNYVDRLAKVDFAVDCHFRVLNCSTSGKRLLVEILARRLKEDLDVDDKGVVVTETRYVYKKHSFILDGETGLGYTPGSLNSFALLRSVFGRAGYKHFVWGKCDADVHDWTRDFVKLYDAAQLAGLTLDMYYSEPKLIGRYNAKTVDNRLDMAMIDNPGGALSQIKLGFFHEGVRRTVTLRADATLTITSADPDDADMFWAEMSAFLLKYLKRPELQTSIEEYTDPKPAKPGKPRRTDPPADSDDEPKVPKIERQKRKGPPPPPVVATNADLTGGMLEELPTGITIKIGTNAYERKPGLSAAFAIVGTDKYATADEVITANSGQESSVSVHGPREGLPVWAERLWRDDAPGGAE